MTNLFCTNAWIQLLTSEQRDFQTKPNHINPSYFASFFTANTTTKQCVKFIFHPRIGRTRVLVFVCVCVYFSFLANSLCPPSFIFSTSFSSFSFHHHILPSLHHHHHLSRNWCGSIFLLDLSFNTMHSNMFDLSSHTNVYTENIFLTNLWASRKFFFFFDEAIFRTNRKFCW